MFRWSKVGRIFNPCAIQGRPWLKEYAQAPATLVFDDFVRVYFSTRPAREADGQYVSNTGFVDLDRKDLTRILAVSENPILPLGELGAFDEFGIYPTSVLRRGAEVHAYYGGWTRCEAVPYDVAIGLAISGDGGVTFTRRGPGPVLSRSLDEPMTVSGPKIREFNGLLYLFYVAGRRWRLADGRMESIFKIRLATSTDGLVWTRCHRDLLEDVLDEGECQASPDVLFAGGRYHMFFSYKYGSAFRGTDRGYRIGYAFSEDLLHWTRDDASAGITLSGDEAWDGQSMAYPHVFALDGRVHMLYLGNDVGRFGFGLATLMEDPAWNGKS